jgi:preprotein translocase subunit SecD
MNPNLKWKAVFILMVILICIYGLIGMPVFPTSLGQIEDNFAHQIKLGLDLQGGTHLILQVQVEEAIARETDETIDGLTSQLTEKNIHTDEIRRVDDTHILVRNVDPSQYSSFSDLVTRRYGNEWNMSSAAGEQNSFLLTLKPSAIAEIQNATMDQSVETIARRINALGLTEPTIQLHGRNDNEILVQLPGEGDPARAKAVILVRGGPFSSQAEALASNGGVLPAGTELIPGRSEAPEGSSANAGEVWYLVNRTSIVTGRDLKPDGVREEPSAQNPGQWQVNFTLSSEAARRFGPFTETNLHKQMAVVLDHSVYTAPVINGRIEDQGMIEGNFTKQSAHDLALVLRAGALPASIKYLYEGTVGPSLGADSIRHGVQASVLSLIVVLLFLLFYYRLAGVNAVLALLLNLVILMAFLALSGAVLTLPGIAGVILTIGMGVDSNVLVFERIREELRYGKSAASAVDAGFDKAFLTIIDTHVTTVVSAFFLFVFGTGPIRGFAITLVVGLVANLFTSIYVSKTIFHYHLAKMDRQAELSI